MGAMTTHPCLIMSECNCSAGSQLAGFSVESGKALSTTPSKGATFAD
jgi:hypothetical protein